MRTRTAPATVAAFAVALSLVVPATVGTTSATAAVECDPFGPATVLGGVPTARSVIGIDLGERDLTTAESDAYLQAISAASDRVVDGVAATSVQGRPLRYAVVGAPQWVTPEGLAELSANLTAIRDPETSDAEAADLIGRTPQVLWVAGNVHGTEESGTDASLRVLHDLAARTDCAATDILDNAVVVVLPTQNPDGRELDTRRNALGFDMNRDWFARTQPETDGKIELMRQLPPQLFIDAHEMGSKGFFFPPNADPVYHEVGETPLDWIYNLYGPAMQDAFARFKYKYFNGSTYDLFYMGYGDTVPAAGFNAAGMTFEKHNGSKASVRVQEQYVAIWASLAAGAGLGDAALTGWRSESLQAASDGAAGLLEPNQLYYEGTAVQNQVPDIRIRHYFLRADDPSKADEVQRIVRRLQRMDVEVHRLTAPLEVEDYTAYGRSPADTTLPAGTYWIPLAQPQKHWIHAMLNEDTYVPFPYFYDVTAWSLPLLGNVPGGRSGAVLTPAAELVAPVGEPAARPLAGAPEVRIWAINENNGTNFESVGWLRWFLADRVGLPFDDRQNYLDYDVSAAGIASGALDGVDVLVVPNGSEATALKDLGRAGRTALASWVRGGGTLVALREAARLGVSLGLTSATYSPAASDVPGSLLRVETAGPLSAGVGNTAWTMYEYDDVWRATTPGTAAVTFPASGDDDWFVSGYASGADELRGTANVIDEAAGAGRVVLFSTDPNYRGFTDGTQRILRNALERAALAAPAFRARPTGVTSQVPGRRTRPAAASVSYAGAMVLSVRPSARATVRAVLRSHRASFDTVRANRTVRFVVDLGGRPADQHPWATAVADRVASLGSAVRSIRLP